MLRTFDLNLLVVLHTLLEERNVTRTGERLGRTQSAISNSLKRLRDHFDDPLLVRTPEGLRPTPRAQELAPQVAEIIRLSTGCVERERRFDPTTAEARFMLGAPDRFSLPVFLPLLENMRKIAPGISVTLRATDRAYAIRMIEQEEIDVAIGWFDNVPGYVSQQFAFEDKFVCLCRAAHPLLAHGPRPELQEVLDYPHLVVSSSGGRRAVFDTILARHGLQRAIAATMTSFTIVPELLQQSNLVGVFTHRTAEYFARRFDLVIVPVPLEVAPIANQLIWHKRFDADEPHAWLRQQILLACAQP
ncbi:LysR family transcriptional regulator [Aliiruegeria sabulilitoris]|uniref:LysR family transcriptional regulator n=1 Tax=Aliiruegeria sabulilitoris TaxID=1510458 RepID=UPI000832C2A2|nr:LysR family transcriptional regulator [Aliiruegeria sabulilitoris]